VAHAWGRRHLGEGDEILLSVMEHHSNLVPWQMLADAVGCKLKFLDIDEEGFVGEVQPLADDVEPATGGSTDVCEVSYITPQGGFSIATAAKSVPWHSWATTACHGMSAGVKGAQAAARVLALTGVDLLTDAELLAAARKDFAERTAGRPYRSPLPADARPPLPQ
jgi:aminobenzoyl-glutamate utilization protein B